MKRHDRPADGGLGSRPRILQVLELGTQSRELEFRLLQHRLHLETRKMLPALQLSF